MINQSNYLLFFLLFIYLNILVVISTDENIFVNYDFNKNYIKSEECGSLEIPCVSLEDAGIKAILENKNGIEKIYIKIIGNINGSTPSSFGNLYSFCGILEINSQDNQTITIDGSNSNNPFINIQEDQYEGCLVPKKFLIKNINFKNWEQTLVNININQETNQALDVASLYIYFNSITMESLGSIISVYPKNIGEIFNSNSISIQFDYSLAKNLKSSSTFAPNSTTDYLPPIYIVGAKIKNLPNIKDNNLTKTPFIYLNQANLISPGSNITNNNFCYPFAISTKKSNVASLDNYNMLQAFDNNSITTLIFISDAKNHYYLFFNVTNNKPAVCSSKQYLGNIFDDSFITFKDSFNSSFDTYISANKPIPVSIFNSNIILNQLDQISFNFNIDSSIVYFDFNLTILGSTITGSNSALYLYYNETLCSCPGCDYYMDGKKANSTDCNPPTVTPTTTGIDTTREPSPSPSLSSSPSSSSSSPKSNSIRNIVIIIVILGSASIASIVLFSFIYKRHKNKKYILNSISSSNTMSEEDNDLAGAAADNDVSPNLEPTTAFEDDDCAQLEHI
ncbi:hypothetical protein ACTFIZ_001325 [Dictyostelium cf. discoideum]